MRRDPGEWLEKRLLERAFLAVLLAALGLAWLCSGGLVLWLMHGTSIGPSWVDWIVWLPAAGFLAAAFYKLYRDKRGWRLSDMEKGTHAEKTIGQAIEFALTRESCAVAHGVQEIARVGDIDHLVATPRGLWVIETKYGRVPKSEFREVLRRIASNVQAVREWAPETPVTGCLVFGSEQEKRPKATYTHRGEKIRAFADPTALMRALRKDAQGTGVSPKLVDQVWELGKLEAPDQSVPAG